MIKQRIWNWLPFIIVMVSEKGLAAFAKTFRLATENCGTTAVTAPGHYVVYKNDRSAGAEGLLLCRFATVEDNVITFLAPNRNEDSQVEGTTTMHFQTAQDIAVATVPSEIVLNAGVEKVINKLTVAEIYPGVKENGTFNQALTSALKEFSFARPLSGGQMGIAKLDRSLRYTQNGMPVQLTAENLEDFLVKQCPGSLLTKTLYGKAVLKNLPADDKKSRGNRNQQEEKPASVFTTPDWSTFA